jgi:hypothetical protein
MIQMESPSGAVSPYSLPPRGGWQSEDAALRQFPTVRKGLDPTAVRSYLEAITTELRRLRAVELELRDALVEAERRASSPQLDEAMLSAAVGTETARILQAAHEAARDVVGRGETRAAELVEEAGQLLAERTAEATAQAREIVGSASASAAALVADADATAAAITDRARVECREMVAEARSVRRRILEDLAWRRRALHVQLEQLRAGKDALLEVVDGVGQAASEVRATLLDAESKAQVWAEQAALAAAEPTDEELASLYDLDGGELDARDYVDESHAGDPGPWLDPTLLGDAAPGSSETPGRPADDDPSSGEASDPSPEDVEPSVGHMPADEVALGDSPAVSDSIDPGEVEGFRVLSMAGLRPVARASESQAAAPGTAVAAPETAGAAPDAVDLSADLSAPAPGGAGASAPSAERVEAVEPLEAVELAGTVTPTEQSETTEPAERSDLEGIDPSTPEHQVSGFDDRLGVGLESVAPVSDTSSPDVPAIRTGEAKVEGAGVEELFARIRASRADTAAQAREVLADTSEDEGAPEVELGGAARADVARGARMSEPADEGARELDAAVLRGRAGQLSEVMARLARSLKRAMQDDQNDVLDRLRVLEGPIELDALLPVEEHLGRYVIASIEGIEEAAAAGWRFGCEQVGRRAGSGGTRSKARRHAGDEDVAGVAAELAREITEALRQRIGSGLSELDSESTAVVELVGAAFREWRGRRIEGVAGDSATAAFALGQLRALKDRGAGAIRCRWIVDDGRGSRCPECDDNVLAGPVAAGEEFPTGHAHPPVHPGCRCLLVPAES